MLLAWSGPARAQDGARRDEPPPAAPAPQLTKAPELLEAAAPVYPPAALEAGLSAAVLVRIHIDATGMVTQVDVVEPVGNGFDEAAVAAAELYVFSPAEWDGVPGPIIVETTIHFTIQEEEAPPPPPPPPPDPEDGAADPAAQGPPSHGGDYRLPVTISGQAVERGSRRKLSGVIVSIAELGLDAITDETGHFYFHGVPPGDYNILAVDDRYDRLERGLTLSPEEQSVELRLWMRAKGGSPYETIVEGEREVLEVTRRTLARRQLTTVPGTFGDPIRVVHSLPGLARSPFATGLLLIRGSNPDDSGLFIDGHRVPLIFHFLGGPSILNPEFLDELHLYPGGYPARFGRSLGGIVAVETRPSESDGVHGSADIDILDTSAYLRVPVGKNGSVAIAGRRSYLDFVLGQALPEPDPGATLVVVPVYYDYQLRFDYDLKQNGHASVFMLGSSDTLDVLSRDTDDETSLDLDTSVKFWRLIGSYKRPIAGGLRLTLSPMYGRDELRFSGAQADAESDFTGATVRQDSMGYRMRVDGRLSPRMVLDAGVDIETRVTRYQARIPVFDFAPVGNQVDIPPEDLERRVDMLSYGLHADLGWDVTDALRLVPGLRLDGYLLSGQARYIADPRLVARYRIDDQWLAKGHVGMFHQPPQAEVFDSLFGNPDTGLERSTHYGLGGEWTPSKLWSVDMEAYFVDRYDLVQFTNDVETNPDTGEVEPVNLRNSGVSDTIGLELMIKREVTSNLYGWLAYTLSRSVQQDEPDDDVIPTPFDQRHTLNAVASYKLDSGWEFGTRFRLSTGRPVTPIVDGTYDSDDNDYRAVRGPTFSDRIKTFHQLDLRVEKTWTYNYFTLGTYLDIQNVLNIANVEGIQYDYRYRETAPVTGIPFLPTLGMRGQW